MGSTAPSACTRSANIPAAWSPPRCITRISSPMPWRSAATARWWRRPPIFPPPSPPRGRPARRRSSISRSIRKRSRHSRRFPPFAKRRSPAAEAIRAPVVDGSLDQRCCIRGLNHRSLVRMPYRRTENVVRRLAEREEAILAAATTIAAEGGMAAVQIAAVAARAGIAAGTVYRYFPSKTDLIAELVAAVAGRELSAMAAAGDAAPGPLSALAACIATFAARALVERRLAWAVIAEPVDAEVDGLRLDYRQALAAELEARIRTAITARHLPEQDTRVAAPAIVGALMEGLIGPLAPTHADPAGNREAVQTVTLLALRALGVVDARALGLVAQCVLPIRA